MAGFELTVRSAFAMPDVAGKSYKEYQVGEGVVDPAEVQAILDSDRHVNVIRVLPGTHARPADPPPSARKKGGKDEPVA